MTRRHDPFTTALDSLRARVEAGAYAPGGPIVILEEAGRLRLSTTPVREAIAHLAGEGLVERGPTSGYLAPRLDAGVLRERYAFRLVCLEAAVVLTRGSPPSAAAGPAPGAAPVDRFARLARETGNAALIAAYDRIATQLAPMRAAEARLFADAEEEARALELLFEEPRGARLRRALRAYHRRRMEAAATLVIEDASLRPPSDGED